MDSKLAVIGLELFSGLLLLLLLIVLCTILLWCHLDMGINRDSISFGLDIVCKSFHFNKIFSEIETDDCCYLCC